MTELRVDPNQTEAALPLEVTTKELHRLFARYADRPFVFVRPGGNAGDQLIYLGADKLARLVGLEVSTVPFEEFMGAEYGREVVLYLHGGGGFNPIWSGKPMESLRKAARHKGVVVQGPQTFWKDEAFLREQVVGAVSDWECERLVLMTRERVSYDALAPLVPDGVECVLDHDTATNLTRGDLAEWLPGRSGQYTFYAIREDKEARAVDQRALFSVWRDPVQRGQTFEGWLRLHAEAKEIVTNRLHSSICGSILGIPTTLLPNSYFKNRAVWERSLSARGVGWSDRIEVDAPSRILGRVRPLRDVMRRGRMQRLVQRFHGVG